MKKLIAIILTIMFLCSAAACGADELNIPNRATEETDGRNVPKESATIDSNMTEPIIEIEDNSQEIYTSDVIINNGIAVGDVILFGGYEWRVLDFQDQKALILSDKVLLEGVFDWGELFQQRGTYVTSWEESAVREYLNGAFYEETFNRDERNMIIQSRLENYDHPWYSRFQHDDTLDRVFLLSLNEVIKYFGDSEQLENRPTYSDEFDIQRLVPFIEDEFNSSRAAIHKYTGEYTGWWLRTSATHQLSDTDEEMSAVSHFGFISPYPIYFEMGIRPAMWIDITDYSPIFADFDSLNSFSPEPPVYNPENNNFNNGALTADGYTLSVGNTVYGRPGGILGMNLTILQGRVISIDGNTINVTWEFAFEPSILGYLGPNALLSDQFGFEWWYYGRSGDKIQIAALGLKTQYPIDELYLYMP